MRLGDELFSVGASALWNIIHPKLKLAATLMIFWKALKMWNPCTDYTLYNILMLALWRFLARWSSSGVRPRWCFIFYLGITLDWVGGQFVDPSTCMIPAQGVGGNCDHYTDSSGVPVAPFPTLEGLAHIHSCLGDLLFAFYNLLNLGLPLKITWKLQWSRMQCHVQGQIYPGNMLIITFKALYGRRRGYLLDGLSLRTCTHPSRSDSMDMFLVSSLKLYHLGEHSSPWSSAGF